jgi:Fe-S-cluster containining protein
MIIIDEILISTDIVEEQFMCNLEACKGACCWEGDWGAPLEPEEMKILDTQLETIKTFLSPASIELLERQGPYAYVPEIQKYGTSLHENGACVFLNFGKDGIARCGIEQAHLSGALEWLKPISCHLYPIRVSKNDETGFEALNYDRWDICSAACTKGRKEKMPVYKFAKTAIVRAYGQEFYDELEAAARHIQKENSSEK